MASIGKDVLWGSPKLAVDGFMLLSGFLMVYHWILREGKFISFWDQLKDFYIRRFFRIAPLYYVLLTAGFVLQDKLFVIKNWVNQIIPPAWGGEVIPFDNPVVQELSFGNIFSHYSFTFGLIPKYANSTILPDWSISLEMQFYFLLPLLVLLLAKFGSFSITFAVLLITITAKKFIGLGMHAGLIARYPQPSLLLFKLNFFLAGMTIAYAYLSKDNNRKIGWLLLGIMSLYGAKLQVFVIALIMVFLLFFDNNGKEFLSKIGSWRISKFVGDSSYALYLLHLMVIYPILYFLFQQDWYGKLAIYPRLLVSLLIVSPIVYGLSYVLHRVIELPGILLGKRIVANFSKNKRENKPKLSN